MSYSVIRRQFPEIESLTWISRRATRYRLDGSGYLAGEFPGGTTTVEGAPVSATVRILYRPAAGALGDGFLVAEVQSAPDGTWLIQNLNENLRYDVVGRKEGFNDVIVADVTPTSTVVITYTDKILPNETFTGALGFIELVGGIPPYAASVVDPLPAGIFPVVNGRQLIIDGTTADDDVFNSTVRITSSNGATKDVPVKLVVGFKAPANFGAETLEDAGMFSVVLTWEITNSTQEVLVFKSTTPFDLDSMPTPIATLTGGAVSYTDDDVIENDVFYYMAASVCEGFTLYSDEVREVVLAANPHWDKVVSLLHFDEPAGATSFVDAAGGDNWGRAGSATTSSERYKYGGVSGIVPTRSRIFSPTHAKYALGTDDFTLEGYLCPLSNAIGDSYGRVAQIGANNAVGTLVFTRIATSSPPGLFVQVYSGGYHNVFNPPAATIPNDEFTHVAVTRQGGVWRMFFAGVMVAEGAYTGAGNNLSGQYWMLGGNALTRETFPGYYDEWRLTKGVARYTENFTPLTIPFLNK